jgi:hypothetical protein
VYRPVDADHTYPLLAGGARADGGLVEVDDLGQGDQRLDQVDDPGHRRRDRGEDLVDEPGRHGGTDQISDQPHTPLDRHVLHDQQIHRQSA